MVDLERLLENPKGGKYVKHNLETKMVRKIISSLEKHALFWKGRES